MGILGAGNIVKRIHLPIIYEMGCFDYIGLADLDLRKAETLSQGYDVVFPMTVEEVLKDKKIDIVLIATPNFLHPIQVKKALIAGKHVICEKPLCLSVKECSSILRLAKRVKRSVFICYSNRFRRDYQYIKKILGTNILGGIQSIKLGWVRSNGIPGFNSWFTRKRSSGGGALVDIGIHLIDLLNDILQLMSIAEKFNVKGRIFPILQKDLVANAHWYVQKKKSNKVLDTDVEKGARATIYNKDIRINLEVSWNHPKYKSDKTYLYINCKNGRIELDTLFGFSPNGSRPECPLSIHFDNEAGLMRPKFDHVTSRMDPYIQQWNYFVGKIKHGSPDISMLRNEIRNAKMIQAIYKSANEKNEEMIEFGSEEGLFRVDKYQNYEVQ